MTCAILRHQLHAGQMRRRRGDGDVPARIGRKLNVRRIFQSNISRCGPSDILGKDSLILRSLLRDVVWLLTHSTMPGSTQLQKIL